MAKKLLEIMRDKIRFKHYSISTEKVYIYWSKKYILFHNKKHPKNMGKIEIEEFLTYLATKLNVSPTTQNQALRAQQRKHIFWTKYPNNLSYLIKRTLCTFYFYKGFLYGKKTIRY
ncbi:MAG: hypothetical protein GY932_11215 [Arcobacter sp.]|nr:hypothetical protein [Arcobacter sp.]